jgi:serine/threonine-protein kinase
MTAVGEVLAGRYELGRLLGRGGMAEVYLGTDRVLQRPVAVKVLGGWLAADGGFVERFRREALAAASFSHPDLVAVYDAGSRDDLHFIVMEYVPGETLAEVIARERRLPAARASGIARDVARALAVAHAAGIVHRDVKPANVMLTPDGRTKLMDLGIARTLDGEDLTRATSILGSPNYLSPEQARGEHVDPRSDIYSLGCVLYEMLAGRPPFDAETPVAVAYKHVHEEPQPPSAVEPTVPAALDAVTLRAMAKDPEDRFATVEELAAALDDRTIPIAPVSTTPMSTGGRTERLPATDPTDRLPRRTDRVPRRNVAPLLGAIGLVAILGIVGAAVLLGGPEPASEGPGTTRSPERTPSPSPSPSPTSSPSPSPSASVVPDGAVEAAVASLAAIVEEGVAEGNITEKAAGEIRKHVEESLRQFADGNTSEAIAKLEDVETEIDGYVEHEEVAHSEEQALDRALEDLIEAMFIAQPPGGGDDEDE